MVGYDVAEATAGCAIGHRRAAWAGTMDGTVSTSAGTTMATETDGRSYGSP